MNVAADELGCQVTRTPYLGPYGSQNYRLIVPAELPPGGYVLHGVRAATPPTYS